MRSSVESDAPALRSYTRLKLQLAAQLRALMETLKKRASESRYDQCGNLMTKLAEDRFTLAVLGQFKRGKSSLMNAIIGRDLLPVGVLPLTSAITILKFGPTERLVVVRENWTLQQELPVSQLAEFVTERGNPGNRKRVKTATVEVPLTFLRRGLEFVDTPGVGSASEANTATTYAFLPECDAALFVTSADAPLTSVELEFLGAIREYAQKIFYVVNKTDLLSRDNERHQVLDFVAKKICEQTNEKNVRLFPLSARVALEAKLHSDSDAYARSGLGALEESLAEFLSGEKASVFLTAIVDRASRLVEIESGEVELFNKARELSEPDRQARLDKLCRLFEERAQERAELFAQLRWHLVESTQNLLTPDIDAFFGTWRVLISRYVHHMSVGSGWRFGADVSARAGGWLLKRLRNKTEQWLRERFRRLEFGSDEIVGQSWKKIVAAVEELSGLAASSFDLPPRPMDESAWPWRLDVKLEMPVLHGYVWGTASPSWLLFFPAIAAPPLLEWVMQRERARLLVAARQNALSLIAQSVVSAVDSLTKETNSRAEEIQNRIVAAVKGTRPPRRFSSQGLPRPEKLNWGEATLESIRKNLSALRLEALRFATPPDATEKTKEQSFLTDTEIGAAATLKPHLRDMEKPITARFRTRGCPVCDYLYDTAFNFFATTQYELYLHEKVQAEFAETRGFCPLHMWQLHSVSSPVGESVGLSRFVEETARWLAQSSRAAEPKAAVSALLSDRNDCPVCILLRETEHNLIQQLVTSLEDAENRQAYARSQGACLRHLAGVIETTRSEETIRSLLTEAARRFGEIAEDMQSYAMKRGALRSPLTNTDENDAALRALIHLASDRTLCAPWPLDREI